MEYFKLWLFLFLTFCLLISKFVIEKFLSNYSSLEKALKVLHGCQIGQQGTFCFDFAETKGVKVQIRDFCKSQTFF